MAVAVILVPVMMVDAFVMEMAEGASFIDRDVGIAFHDVDLIIFVPCHFRIIRVVMMLFRNFLAAATAASAMIMAAFAAVIVGMALMAFVMSASAFAAMVVGAAFMVFVMAAFAAMIVGVAFVIVVMPAAATVVFFVFLVVGMFFGVMDGFLLLMAVAASAMMYMLFIVLFHGMSPYPEWKRCFLSGIILWCYFSILQMHRKWSMRNTLIFQVGRGR